MRKPVDSFAPLFRVIDRMTVLELIELYRRMQDRYGFPRSEHDPLPVDTPAWMNGMGVSVWFMEGFEHYPLA